MGSIAPLMADADGLAGSCFQVCVPIGGQSAGYAGDDHGKI